MCKLFLKHILPVITVSFFFGCSAPTPAGETGKQDTVPTHSEEVPESAEPAITFHISSYDGSIENARLRMSEIIKGRENKELSAYSYHYDNGSGENPMQGILWFSSVPQTDGKEDVWSLRLASDFYAIEYFFDEGNKLFAIRQYPVAKDIVLSAEIFYAKDGSIMKGSWIQRPNDVVTQLADYTGDYWYDFLEGYPFYKTVAQLKDDKSLQYQQ
jgi:hypothetical protein